MKTRQFNFSSEISNASIDWAWRVLQQKAPPRRVKTCMFLPFVLIRSVIPVKQGWQEGDCDFAPNTSIKSIRYVYISQNEIYEEDFQLSHVEEDKSNYIVSQTCEF